MRLEDPDDVLEQLSAVLDAAQRVNPSGLAVDAAERWLFGLQRLAAQLDAVRVEATRAGDEQKLQQRSGTRNIGDHVAKSTNADPRAVRRDRRLGAFLASYPALAEAFAAGVLTRDHVAVLMSLCTDRTREHFWGAQDFFVHAAQELSFVEFTRAAGAWAQVVDPDGKEPEEQTRQRSVAIDTKPDGTVTGKFRFDTLGGKAFREALERKAQDLYRASGGDDGRTLAQRRADALVALVSAGIAATKAAPPPLIHVVISLAILEKLLAQLAEGVEFPVDLDTLDDADRRCHFADGTPLHPKHLQALLTVGVLRRLVLDDESIPVDQSKGKRFYPPDMKLAMTAAQRGACHIDGCTAPIWWHEADHLIPWSHTHTTTWTNGRMACRGHNHAKGNRIE